MDGEDHAGLLNFYKFIKQWTVIAIFQMLLPGELYAILLNWPEQKWAS